MVDLLVVSGPPGAGKSTVARVIADRWQPSALIEADAFFAFVRGGPDPWTPDADDQNRVVIDAVSAAAGRFVVGGMATVYDGVVGPWFVPTLLAGSGLDQIDYAVLLPPLEVCLQRVADRREHGFTDAGATAHMHAQFADADLDRRHMFAGVGSADELADAIERARSTGSLRWG